jgi:hypothetical protein
MTETNTDWLDICLPLAEQVEQEQYTPNTEELLEFFED